MIDFNRPTYIDKSLDYIRDVITVQLMMCGDGKYTKLCNQWLLNESRVSSVMLTTSCTHALEMAALLCEIKEGDEVIMPSYTFCSTADAFVLRGAKIVFVDIRPDTMNIDENLIEEAITPRTKAIVPVHYAGVGCEMDTIMDIAKRYSLYVIEDSAQGIMASYKGKPLGSFGDYGCLSFHETKNFTMGEGGALLIRDEKNVLDAEIIREKGTDRARFFRGEVDKYRWVDKGSSYLPSEMNAAYLWAQLEQAQDIFDDRMKKWNLYYKILQNLADEGFISLPYVPEHCVHNAHMFYIKTRDIRQRTDLIAFLKSRDIHAVFHYIPLHNAPAGLKYGRMSGEDKYTTVESERILRLPLFHSLTLNEVEYVCEAVKDYYVSFST